MALKVSVPDFLTQLPEQIPDKLADKRWHSFLMARKIRRLRTMRGLTQKQLADLIGVDEAAIRNYEIQKASPKQAHIDKLAEALGVRPESLRIYDMGAGDSITANALFQLSEIYGIEPHGCSEYAYLRLTHNSLNDMLARWASQYSHLRSGDISQDEYDIWKDCLAFGFNPSDFPKKYRAGENGVPELIIPWEPFCFSSKLKRMRTERSMTQGEFADLIGIKVGVYRSYEHGRRLPKVSVVAQIAERLNITVGSLSFFDFGSPVQAFHALFQLANEFGLRPDIIEGTPVLRTQTAGLEQIIDQWASSVELSCEKPASYLQWKDCYEPDDEDNRLAEKSRYTDSAFDEDGKFLGLFSAHDPYDARYPHGYLKA